MANKKSDQPEPPDNEKLLEQKVDRMMDIKGAAPPAQPSGDEAATSDVAAVAASVNQALTENLGAAPKEDPKSAPELPGETDSPPKTEPPAEPDPATDPPDQPEPAENLQPDALDDSETDKAVDEITANEGDLVLAVEDAKRARRSKAAGDSGGGWKRKLGSFFKSRWSWLILVVLLLILFGLPVTRYKILGLAVKKSVTVTILDSNTSTPVSSAEVELAGQAAKTDANGKARVKAGLGKHDLTVSKKYYSDLNTTYFVGFKAAAPQFKLTATGRLVPVTVLNSITGKPLAGAQVQSSGTSAKTDAKGKANIALPAATATAKGQLSLSGYNGVSVNLQITDRTVKANTFNLTPAGQVYFLSNLSGNLDVVKSNLDGSGRKTVLAGTGKEDARTTSLLAARDWRYLVLKAHREGSQEALYLIDTSNDKVSLFDNSDADFQLVGWYGHDFIYSLTRNDLPDWKSGRQALKSYDADSQKLSLIDQGRAEGKQGKYAYQNLFDFYILNGQVAYSTEWYGFDQSGDYDLSGKTDTIRTVQPNGQNKKDYKSFAADKVNYSQAKLYEPNDIYYEIYDNNAKPSFYVFDGRAVTGSGIDQTEFDRDYPTFLLSPSGGRTFWSELRDGKNALFTGDANGAGKKQIASLSDFAPYGWYSDDYVLVAKNSSELYVASPTGLTAGRQPLKITDYYKPAQTYQGYGYGYGGL